MCSLIFAINEKITDSLHLLLHQPQMITALFIYDAKGDVLMSKLYKDEVRRNIADVFRIQVISANSKNPSGGNQEVRSPVLTLGSTSFIYIKSGLLWISAVTRSNQDCSVILEFLYNLELLLKTVLMNNSSNDINAVVKMSLTEEVITQNFNMIFELLDEVIEFGYPTNLELNYLKTMITSLPSNDKFFKLTNNLILSGKLALSNKSKSKEDKEKNSKIDPSALDMTWRSTGIKYRRNEIFLNVEENLNVLMDAQSQVLRSYIEGKIHMKTHLSGMPLCRFGLSDRVLLGGQMSHDDRMNEPAGENLSVVALEDTKFHQCVDLTKFDNERVIQFIPPDGDFQLMTYHVHENINLPFMVYPQVQEIGALKLLYKIRLQSMYSSKVPAMNVVIKIPTPKGVIKQMSTSSSGKTKFHPEESQFVWKFNKYFGNQEQFFTAEVELADKTVVNWTKPPIKLEFTLEMIACSGLTVRYLKVQESSNYRTIKWVKYLTQAASYDIRC